MAPLLKLFSPYVAHIALAIAIIAEVIGTSFIKDSAQFTKLKPSLIVLVSFVISFQGLAYTVKTIPVGIVYAIWAGLGIVLINIIGVFKYKEVPDTIAILGITLIIIGVVIVNLRISPH